MPNGLIYFECNRNKNASLLEIKSLFKDSFFKKDLKETFCLLRGQFYMNWRVYDAGMNV